MRSSWIVFSIADGVRRSAIHPQGKAAVVADVTGGLTLYRLADREELARLGRVPESRKARLLYSPDGRVLAVVRTGALELFDVTHSPYKPLTYFQSLPKDPIDAVLFSGDGQTVAVLDKTTVQIDQRSLQIELDSAPAHANPIMIGGCST